MTVAVGVGAGAAATKPIWHGIRWLFTWTDRRAIRRDAKLQAWEASLVEREKQFRIEIEQQLELTRAELRAVREDLDAQRRTTMRLVDVVSDLSTELEGHAPRSPVLIRARKLLKTLPLPAPAPELEALAAQLDEPRGTRGNDDAIGK
jgi:hypothetical protein